MLKHLVKATLIACLAALATGCASPVVKRDYTAYKQSHPRTILVLPPVNDSPEVNAPSGVLSQMTYPLAEAGYYVVPVALMTETFKQNGLATANDIQAVSPAKLREIFGADAALYTTIKRYGVRYSVIDSVAEVEVSTKLVDLKNGQELWAGSAAANNANNNNNNVGGLVGMLVNAAIKQIVNSATDATYPVAGMASNMLLSAGRVNGVLYGPRSPQYGTD
ncbi:DUF799 domain-containing protein [Chromobacterium violaceum]|uniref:Lipoprotein NMB1124/NMB1162 n=2 Tax=Chromobacterium violaceum TaxID=536 RepID=A0AAX2M451_CHRVL|nr:DUF799 domain-containing protein [Chromobacterium violaceum]MBP4047800.1 DUF799 domain-containing protein [Chromobacterium violaceum]MBX9268272.1 DUF799 domain-containing protein [Chromobacterium violaceum]OLZ75815.1 hypothetical protein BS642_17305 [Chromobacterium violaceum]OQS09647.1 hypothetical protein B0T38_13330 [Chromobacterium violaceum]OQS25509.1 hypothetical protein B0T37_12935 [Chromobacterium violaceum]